MKFASDRPYSDPEKAARKILEIANSVEAVQDGKIYIELINGPFLYREKGTPAEYQAGLDLGSRAAGGNARERNLRQVHAGGRGSVCLNGITRAVAPAVPDPLSVDGIRAAWARAREGARWG